VTEGARKNSLSPRRAFPLTRSRGRVGEGAPRQTKILWQAPLPGPPTQAGEGERVAASEDGVR